ncbi:MAG: hypothetical protein GW748_03860 [Alphaproteobacteria bacterium]|nr:hypothetical protein [Alphaproteobacteria bacterium]NCQ66860.1 hypothetical protein [Alphaproteobacteria bacterium]NCT07428.1 hypothetical protein [Alphaproteobacteria bacterium]
MHIVISTDLYFKHKSLFYQKTIKFLSRRNISYIKYLEANVIKKGEESYSNSSFRKKLIKLEDLEEMTAGVLPPDLEETADAQLQLELLFVCFSQDKLPISVLETGEVFQEIDGLTFRDDPYEGLKLEYSFAPQKHQPFVSGFSKFMARAHSIRDFKHPVLYDIIIGVVLLSLLIYFFL